MPWCVPLFCAVYAIFRAPDIVHGLVFGDVITASRTRIAQNVLNELESKIFRASRRFFSNFFSMGIG